MYLDESRDFLTQDNLQQIQFRSARKGGLYSARATISGVSFTPIRTSEKSPTGGVYLGAETSFDLPALYFPARATGGPPKPGDIIEDAARNEWTVLRSTPKGLDGSGTYQRYACDCINLILAFDLSDQVVIQTCGSGTLDSTSAEVKNWQLVPGTPIVGRVQELEQVSKEERGVLGFERHFDIILSRQLPIDPSRCRVPWPAADGSQGYLDCTGFRDVGGRLDVLPVLGAVRKV